MNFIKKNITENFSYTDLPGIIKVGSPFLSLVQKDNEELPEVNKDTSTANIELKRIIAERKQSRHKKSSKSNSRSGDEKIKNNELLLNKLHQENEELKQKISILWQGHQDVVAMYKQQIQQSQTEIDNLRQQIQQSTH